MSSRQRIIPILDGNLHINNAREPRDVGHTIRELLKFSLAISAVGSAAYGAYQAFLQTEKPRSSTVAARQEERRPAKSFFEVLIEADREALKNHEPVGRSPFFSELRGTLLPGGAEGSTAASRQSLRSTFGNSTQAGRPGANAWKLAFLSEPAARAPVPAANATPPAPKAQASSAVAAGPAASSPAAPASPARPQQGFAEARRAAPPPRPDTTASSGVERFAEVDVGAPKQLARS